MTTPQDYIDQVEEDKKGAFLKLRETILAHIPEGFEECINYKMLGYVVPKSTYPAGYHCDTSLPLPFANLAAQKKYIALYHSGIYTDENVLHWFQEEYAKRAKYKLDMGKSCIRFKRMDDIPYDLIGELMEKFTVDDWIKKYEAVIKR
ncbi:MAG: DUF1801 domain-containing protein [Bacteroidota bacterium]